MSMSNDKPTMPTLVAVNANYLFNDKELVAWIAKCGWSKPVLYAWEHHLNPAIARVIAAFPA